jgi:hypothetical protein
MIYMVHLAWLGNLWLVKHVAQIRENKKHNHNYWYGSTVWLNEHKWHAET